MRIGERSRSALSLALIVAVVFGGVQWLQWRDRAEQGRVLRELARPGDLLMLSSNTCVYCTRARVWLKAQQVPHRECFIETDAVCRAEYQARGAAGTPTLVVRGQTQLGFDPQRVARALSPPAAGPG
jgi:glutaredoxin